jgi:hypothetical protein
MLNHHPAAELAREDHHAPRLRRVRRAATVLAWLVAVAALAALVVLETAGRYFP